MFWAPWCGVCRRELPRLAHYYRDNGSAEVQVLAIGTAAASDQVRAYVEGHPGTFPFPSVYDEGDLLQEAFGVRAYPTYVLFDEEGVIQLIHRGGGVLQSKRYRSQID